MNQQDFDDMRASIATLPSRIDTLSMAFLKPYPERTGDLVFAVYKLGKIEECVDEMILNIGQFLSHPEPMEIHGVADASATLCVLKWSIKTCRARLERQTTCVDAETRAFELSKRGVGRD